MSIQSILFNLGASRSDKKRDSAIPLPENVAECRNVSYSSFGQSSMLDVYFPKGTTTPLPTIVSIHGGGYVYGTKEIYRRYGMDMARRGFAFVNFNYRLAPKWKFPTPLYDTNSVMEWIVKNAARYNLDPSRIILVGDSAGAQLASQYAAIATNPEYAAHFDLKVPNIRIRALGLNCGMYNLGEFCGKKPTGIAKDYLGSKPDPADPRFQVAQSITAAYPPAFITTACKDFLRANAQPMCDFLTGKGIDAQWRCYGNEADETVGHVFHVNILLPDAIVCNDDSAAFFRQYV